jgi:hypothetical protein
MTTDQAQSAVSISALVVASVFAYRKLTEATTQGSISAAPWGHFVLGFGFVYVTLSIVAQAAPELGGMSAVLVAAGDVLANGKSVAGDISSGLAASTERAASGAPAAGQPSAQQVNTATGAR